MVDNQQINLELWHTAMNEDYARLRPLSYADSDVFVVCFSLVSQTSYGKVRSWINEIHEYAPGVPVVLVGTKSERRDQLRTGAEKGPDEDVVSEEQGYKLKDEIGAVAYVECSAKEEKKVEEVFIAAAKAAISHPRVDNENEGKGCCDVA